MDLENLRGPADKLGALRMMTILAMVPNLSEADARILQEHYRRSRKHRRSVEATRRKGRKPKTGSVRAWLNKHVSGWRQIPNLTLARRLKKEPAFAAKELDSLRTQIRRAKKSDR